MRTIYGESLDPAGPPPTDSALASTAQLANLRGRPRDVYDCAGLVTSIAHDFKGNLLSASRRLAADYQTEPNWPGAALQTETFTTSTTFDALNRVTSATAPDGSSTNGASVTRPVYNEASLLDAVYVAVRGATESPVVNNLDYNARGQRIRCQNQNGTVTTYQYDPKTFRLKELLTMRGTSIKLQHLVYSYDPVGNITDIQDLSNWDPVLSALTVAGITGGGRYTYDAVYRLLSATGREHPGGQPDGRPSSEPPVWAIPHGNDLQALQGYREELSYDAVGNILETRHLRGGSSNASWSRRYLYADDSNRLLRTSIPGDPDGTYSAVYGYQNDATNDGGAHGSMTSMPHLAAMEWDYADRLTHTLKSEGSAQNTHFTYDASGQRVRKVYLHDGVIEERIYLGGYEIYRRHTSGSITATPQEERQTLHVMDDQRRVAMVESKTRDTRAAVSTPTSRWRFQLDNHLGSAMLEIDATGNVISYEEYHPYGTTAFQTGDGNVEVSAKRYRYTGKEKDEETGLYYHGARYYAAWLGRWATTDPAGMADGLNLYRYSRDNPIVFSDPGGTESKPFAAVGSADYQVGTRTDAQLFRFLSAMTPEQRGALRQGSTGAFQARVDAFNQKYKMGTVITVPEVTIEGSPPEPEETPLAEPAGLAHLQALTGGVRNSPVLGLRSLTSTAIGGTFAAGAAVGGGVVLVEAVPVVAASAETASLAVATSPRLVAAGEFLVNALSAEGAPTITAGLGAGGVALRQPAAELADDAAQAGKRLIGELTLSVGGPPGNFALEIGHSPSGRTVIAKLSKSEELAANALREFGLDVTAQIPNATLGRAGRRADFLVSSIGQLDVTGFNPKQAGDVADKFATAVAKKNTQANAILVQTDVDASVIVEGLGRLFGKPNASNIERVVIQRSNGALSFYSRNNFR